jgi:flagellar hook assembly protein FlgD
LVRRFAGAGEPGEVSIVWDGTDTAGNRVGSGLYAYQLRAGGFRETKKMVLVQ